MAKQVIQWTIPKREWTAYDFLPADMACVDREAIERATEDALLAVPCGGYQTAKCSGWKVSIRGLKVTAREM